MGIEKGATRTTTAAAAAVDSTTEKKEKSRHRRVAVTALRHAHITYRVTVSPSTLVEYKYKIVYCMRKKGRLERERENFNIMGIKKGIRQTRTTRSVAQHVNVRKSITPLPLPPSLPPFLFIRNNNNNNSSSSSESNNSKAEREREQK